MFSTIDKTKFGNCSQCSLTDTNVVKRGKELFCLNCARDNKNKEQITKANERQKVRSLVKYERAEGLLDSQTELILDLDRVVSRYLRLREMGKDGKVQCFTCPTKRPWNYIHAGHFISRSHLGLRWDLTYNIRCQCPNCNVTLHGNLEAFKRNLEIEHNGITDYLYEQSKEVYSPTRDELKQMLFDFQLKLNTVENKLKQYVKN